MEVNGKAEGNVSDVGRARSDRRGKSKIFLALHCGAGSYSSKKKKAYEELSKRACLKGLSILYEGGSADDAVIQSMIILENSKLLNAGKGSNLTVNETVECDAGFMSGNGRFGGIGAAPGLPNPCVAAQRLAGLSPEVLVPPNLIAGEAAKLWASSIGLKTCQPSEMVCRRALKMHARYVSSCQEVQRVELSCKMESDTLGVIALDKSGHVAASGSTGGGLYKIPGRVGPVAQYGCGVFARDGTEDDDIKTAFAGTGTGEFLTELRFAATCDNHVRLKNGDPIEGIKGLMDTMVVGKKVMNCPSRSPVVGVIGLVHTSDRGEFVACHNADNMIYAFGGGVFKRNIQVCFSKKTTEAAYKIDVFGI